MAKTTPDVAIRATTSTAQESSRKTVDKAMSLLMQFTRERPELSVTELSQKLGMHKSMVSRLGSSLRQWGMLEQNPVTTRLRIGPAAFRIGTLFSQRNSLAELATPQLADLVRSTGHSAHMSVLDGLRILVLAAVESPNALRVIMRVGDQRHLHATAAGKLFLAHSDKSLLEALLAPPGPATITADTITAREDLLRAITRARIEGIAWNIGEHTPGAGAAAAPVLGETGSLVAAVSTVFPIGVVDAKQKDVIASQTVACANALATRYRTMNNWVHR